MATGSARGTTANRDGANQTGICRRTASEPSTDTVPDRRAVTWATRFEFGDDYRA